MLGRNHSTTETSCAKGNLEVREQTSSTLGISSSSSFILVVSLQVWKKGCSLGANWRTKTGDLSRHPQSGLRDHHGDPQCRVVVPFSSSDNPHHVSSRTGRLMCTPPSSPCLAEQHDVRQEFLESVSSQDLWNSHSSSLKRVAASLVS